MKIRAAVLTQFGAPLEVREVDLAEPQAGEVLVRLLACGICHTDMYTASGVDPSGYSPTVLGHEGAGIVEQVGDGVTSVSPGDLVVTLFSPQCRECVHCLSPDTNLCLAIREQQNHGYLPDGTTRLSLDGEPLRHFMGTSTFARVHGDARDRAGQGLTRRVARPGLPVRVRPVDRSGRGDQHGQGEARVDVRGVRRRDGGARRRRRLPAPGRRADHLRRPLRGAARARPRPGRDRHLDRRPGHRPEGARGDRRVRRRLHLRGHRAGGRDAPGGRVGADGLGSVHRRRRGRQGRDAGHHSRGC